MRERLLLGTYEIGVQARHVNLVNGLDAPARATLSVSGGSVIPTIAELLAEADAAEAEGADVVTIQSAQTDGHPTLIEIDEDTNTVGDEACYEITEFRVNS